MSIAAENTTGQIVSTDSTYTFTVTGDRTLTALFEQIPVYTITATIDPPEAGTVTGAGKYQEGATVTLVAAPADGYKFSGWKEGGQTVSAGATYSFAAAADRALVAALEELPIKQDNIFGVVWNYDNESTALERLSIESDPYGFVTDVPNSEPVPAVGDTGGSSYFDSYMPWSGVQEYNIIGSGVQYKYGDADFSRSLYDTMVYIPEFWYKVVNDSTSKKRYFYISSCASTGFEKHPGSGKYVSRYTANSEYKSISGNQSAAYMTRATARTNAKSKGTGWQLLDFSALCAIQLLYLVEFADWNSQAKIGRGYVDSNHAQINTGATDSMKYHTGRADGEDGKTAIQYRHIENPWGNLDQFVDGINFYGRVAYVCADPLQYADNTNTNYTNAGVTLPSTNGYIKNFGYSDNNNWCFIPNESGGADNTYIPDNVSSLGGWKILYFGGHWNIASLGGLFRFDGHSAATASGEVLGVRLLFSS